MQVSGAGIISRAAEDLRWFDERGLAADGLDKPPSEYEIAHTYPISVPAWSPASRADFLSRLAAEAGRPFHVYLHIPFCARSCKFCFYYREIAAGKDIVESYIERLLSEVRSVSERMGGRIQARSLYIGGGTPSFLRADQLARLLEGLFQHVDPPKDGGMACCEVSPESVTSDKLSILKGRGFNRVSMGAQSTDDAVLQHANRPHDRPQIFKAAEALGKAGFDEWNIDLMYGLPGQSLESWESTLADLDRLRPDAFTAYYYRRVPGTEYAASIPRGRLPEWKTGLVMRRMAALAALERGYAQGRCHYFCRPEKLSAGYRTVPAQDGKPASRMVGFGTMARSLLGDDFFFNAGGIRGYLGDVPERFGEVTKYAMTPADRICRTVLRTLLDDLRMEKRAFEAEHGVAAADYYGKVWDLLLERCLVEDAGDAYLLTGKGVLLNEQVARLLYPPAMAARLRRLVGRGSLPMAEAALSAV